MIEPNYNKLIIYIITLVFIISGVIGVCEIPNDNTFLELIYLLMIIIPMIIQVLCLC